MRLSISRFDDFWVTRLSKEGRHPDYVRHFTTYSEVKRYIDQIKLVYPDLVIN